MQKKGQVTIFIILGLLIVLFVALFFVFTSLDQKQIDTEKQTAVHKEIEACIETIIIQGIRSLSATGGFYEYPEHYVIYALENNPVTVFFPYYYKDQEDTAPTKDVLEEQFGKYIISRSDECSSNLTESRGMTISTIRESSASVSLGEKSIIVTYDPGIALVIDDETVTVQEIETEIPTGYYTAYRTALALAAEQNARGNTFCISCLVSYSNKGIINKITVEEIALSPYYAILYMLNFTEQSRGEEIFFMFAGRYALADEEKELSILDIKDQTIIIGYFYNFTVTAEGENVVFSDSTDLFDIDATTGEISFYPDEDDIGTHLIEISAMDASNNTDSALFYLTISSLSDAPVLNYIGYVQGFAQELFVYNVTHVTQTGNQTVYYTDDTELFDIGLLNGNISFTPTQEQQGTYNITITAITDKGVSASEMMYLIII